LLPEFNRGELDLDASRPIWLKAAITPVSPRRAPSARKEAARMLLPEPGGPATSSE